jgi:flavin-dependent dehydrogenase
VTAGARAGGGKREVVIVGAGATGAACAAFLAEAGFRVLCLERRTLAEAGARWINGVPRAAFEQAGIALPEAPEHQGGPSPFHAVPAPAMRLADRGERSSLPALTIGEHDVMEVDMRLLVARLQARARRAGAELVEGVAVAGWRGEALETSLGPLEARVFIDASGLAGARLLGQPPVPRGELCAAAQQVHDVADAAGARRFLDSLGARPGEAIAFLGVAGGYSVLNVRVHRDLHSISILTGALPALGYPSGKDILEHFVAEHAWVGAARFGGSAAIPLRRPYDRLASERVALVGDAGCQVFPAHGSGVGSGLVAARLLADTLVAERPLRDYEVAWHRQHGALMASFDVMRRWSQGLDGAAVASLLTFGLTEASLMRAGLNQELPRVSLRALLRLGPGLRRALAEQPALARSLGAAALRSKLVHALYTRYPRDAQQVPAWSRAVARLCGE